MLEIVKYSDDRRDEWNSFLPNSRDGLFMFHRDYMEYHSDRFIDHSLMIHEGKEAVALLPANLDGKVLASHNGLTFGGFITNPKMTVPTMLKIFDQLMHYLAAQSINKLVYKCIPYIYHSIPAEEDRYALFRKGAKLYRRDVTSTILLSEKVRFQEIRRRSIKKATSANLQVRKVDDFQSYWDILTANLAEKYSTKPVHSLTEIEYLHSKFPDNIKLVASYQGNAMLAGVVIYESRNVAHAQYISSSEEGRRLGALDAVFSYLIEEYYRDKRYFDFGISTESEGRYLNEGLVFFKEGFGARAVVHDSYEVDVD
jgi:hypothetical protein